MKAPWVALVGFTAWASGAVAQDGIAPLRDRYVACVRESSINEFSARHERAMAVEQAFLACATEERAILTYMALALRTPSSIPQAQAAMVTLKQRLKQEIIPTLP